MMDDPRFMQMALKLGYSPHDLSPISMEGLEAQSMHTLQSMTPVEQTYYLKKKYEALESRQNKIYGHIERELKK